MLFSYFLSVVVFALFASSFSLTHSYSGIIRAWKAAEKGIVEASVVQYGPDGVRLEFPFFDLESMKASLDAYLGEALIGYADPGAFAVSVTGGNYIREIYGGEYKALPMNATASFSCPVRGFFEYSDTATFAIVEGMAHE